MLTIKFDLEKDLESLRSFFYDSLGALSPYSPSFSFRLSPRPPPLLWGTSSLTVTVERDFSLSRKPFGLQVESLDDQTLQMKGELSTYDPPRLKSVSSSCHTFFMADRLTGDSLFPVLRDYLNLFSCFSRN